MEKFFQVTFVQILSIVKKTGEEIYENMIQERLYPESTTKVFDPLKKVLLKVFKNAEKENKVKMPDRVLKFSDNANLW